MYEYIPCMDEERRIAIKQKELLPTADAPKQEIGCYFYRMAQLFAKMKDLERSLNCFIEAFLIRGMEERFKGEEQWMSFFSRQFSIYLLGKNRLFCSLSEGDMIHDMLRMEYEQALEDIENSELPFHPQHIDRWFAALEFDFPWNPPEVGQINPLA